MCNRFLHWAHRGYIPQDLGNLLLHHLHHPAAVPVRTGHSQYGHWFWGILSTQGLCWSVPVQHRLHLSQCFLSRCLLSLPGPQSHLKKLMGSESECVTLLNTVALSTLLPPTRNNSECTQFNVLNPSTPPAK